MKLLTALLPFLAVLALTACGITYMGGGRSFATADEAMAAGRSLTDELVANVEPLPSPIGGPVVIVLPSQAGMSGYGYEQTLARLKTTSALHPGADLPGGVSKGLLLIHKRH